MKNPNESADKLAVLLEKSGDVSAPEFQNPDDPVAVLIQSFLLWESTTAKAGKAYNAICETFIDVNELRVSLPYEIAAVVGERSAFGLERAQRLRAVLNHVFKLEHDVTLDRLKELGKRDVRKYLDGLEGMVPYVSARTALLGFDAHAIPVDEQLRRLLVAKDIVENSTDLYEVTSWIARQIKASDGRMAHYALQAVAEKQRRSTKRSGGTRKRKKTTAKKGTSKKKSTHSARRSKKKSSTSRKKSSGSRGQSSKKA